MVLRCIAILVCLDKEAEAGSLSRTLQPFKENLVGNMYRECIFYIYAPVGQRVQMTCSVIRIATTIYLHPSYFKVRFDIDLF